jgi:hypothetical protein
MIVPFRTPFWTKEKQWLVICNVLSTRSQVEMYTSPICTLFLPRLFDPNVKTISNFERENQDSPVLETVYELSVKLKEMLADDGVSHLHHCCTRLSVDRMCLNSRCSIAVELVSYLDCEPKQSTFFRCDRCFRLIRQCVSIQTFLFDGRFV